MGYYTKIQQPFFSNLLHVKRRTVQNIWKKVKRCRAAGTAVDLVSKKAQNCGCKRVDIDLSHVTNIPLNQRTTIRSLAGALNVSKTKMHKVFKEGQVRHHSRTLKPYLRE